MFQTGTAKQISELQSNCTAAWRGVARQSIPKHMQMQLNIEFTISDIKIPQVSSDYD